MKDRILDYIAVLGLVGKLEGDVGTSVKFDRVLFEPKPVQRPHPPIWLGGGHPDAIRRAATIADGWMGSGGSSNAAFVRSVPILKQALEEAGRDSKDFPISKRVFVSVDERPEAARAELHRWFTVVYRNPEGTDASGIHGTPETVRERLRDGRGVGRRCLRRL